MLDKILGQFVDYTNRGSFGIKDKIFLMRQFAFLISGGVSIVEAVQTISSNTSNPKVRSLCNQINDNLNKGESLSRSMSRMPMHFTESDVNIIRSGESSGDLVKVLTYLANEYEFIHNIQGKYISAMSYPALLMGVSIIAVFYLFISVLPNIFEIIQDFENVQIPTMTQWMMSFTTWMQNNVKNILIGFVIIGVGISMFLGSEYGKKYRGNLILDIPILGRIVRYYNLVKFFRYMKLMLSSGMNYIDSFAFLKNIMTLYPYQIMLESVIVGLRKGQNIYDNMKYHTNIIPSESILLVKTGEQTANLPNTVQNIIDLYEGDLNKSLDGLSKMIEPVMIIFVGVIILGIAVSIFGVIGGILDSAQMGG